MTSVTAPGGSGRPRLASSADTSPGPRSRNAIRLMQNNALIGLLLVLVVTWLFLGSRIAVLTSIASALTAWYEAPSRRARAARKKN